MGTGRMVRVTTVANPVTARILAAQLGAEGVVWEMRGDSGMYPVGPVEILVDERDLEVAREVLTAGDGAATRSGATAAAGREDDMSPGADAVDARTVSPGPPSNGRRRRRWHWVLVTVCIVVLVELVLGRLVESAL